mmetsp:Transcript_142067/g.395964  ORF Transcript_142067/g.395964 Transcript_142067/m.395964 type:complete len:408 (-) Transcript_142067:775-1998(-)
MTRSTRTSSKRMPLRSFSCVMLSFPALGALILTSKLLASVPTARTSSFFTMSPTSFSKRMNLSQPVAATAISPAPTCGGDSLPTTARVRSDRRRSTASPLCSFDCCAITRPSCGAWRVCSRLSCRALLPPSGVPVTVTLTMGSPFLTMSPSFVYHCCTTLPGAHITGSWYGPRSSGGSFPTMARARSVRRLSILSPKSRLSWMPSTTPGLGAFTARSTPPWDTVAIVSASRTKSPTFTLYSSKIEPGWTMTRMSVSLFFLNGGSNPIIAMLRSLMTSSISSPSWSLSWTEYSTPFFGASNCFSAPAIFTRATGSPLLSTSPFSAIHLTKEVPAGATTGSRTMPWLSGGHLFVLWGGGVTPSAPSSCSCTYSGFSRLQTRAGLKMNVKKRGVMPFDAPTWTSISETSK